MSTLPPIFTSRSAYEDACTCPRVRFWGWEFLRGLPKDDGTVHVGGISPRRKSIYLVTGSAIHEGIGELLRILKEENRLPMESEVDHAVELALHPLDEAILTGGCYSPKVTDDWQDWKMQEARALAEGLTRAFAMGPLANFHDSYEVLEIEKEDTARFTPQGGERDLYFQARTDALMRDRSNGEINYLSIKSATEWSKLNEMSFRRDVQGLTEAIALESRPEWVEKYGRVSMVQMLIALKGKNWEDKVRIGNYYHLSPLLTAWKKVEQFGRDEWAWSYEFPKGDGMSRLGKGWVRTSTWDNYPGGMKAWVKDLMSGQIQKDAGMAPPWESVFHMPEPWGRSDREMASIKRQITHRELEIAANSDYMHRLWLEFLEDPCALRLNLFEAELDRLFPQNKKSCVRYGGSCWADEICHGNAENVERLLRVEFLGDGDALRLGLRQPHHSYVVGE